MMLLLLNLLQQQPQRISRVVIVGAVLVFVAGVSLLVYFYRRYKRIEKEPEEDWDSSRRSLFVNAKPQTEAPVEEIVPEPVEVAATIDEQLPAHIGGTRKLASDIEMPSLVATEPEPKGETIPLVDPGQPSSPPVIEHRPTEILASPAPNEPVKEPEAGHDVAFDEEVWAGLEVIEHTAPSQPTEPLSARVDAPSHREPFEPPQIKRISHREPYETPRIEPLTPREASATRHLQSPPPPIVEQPVHALSDEPIAQGTTRLGSASGRFPQPIEPAPDETRAAEFAAASQGIVHQPSIPPTASSAGSILGLPARPSRQPFVFGESARPSEEAGIGSLTNYGKDLGPKGGRAGTIALLAVVVLLGGAVALYLAVPSVHSRVGAFVAHLRGTDTQAALEMKPKAQIIPSYRPEVNKNMVKARGAVDNISGEQLENLSVEVALQRGADAPPEVRTVPVSPNPLPPNQRGLFEFEYDGKRDTGFAGYKITRLLSNGNEVKFRSPTQK